jgi:hypothetical protein
MDRREGTPLMKSTKAVVRQRVEEVFRLRIEGAELFDIREYANAPERNWQLSDSQLRRYISRADALCEKLFDAKAAHLLSRHLLQRRTLYAHALRAGDYGTALRVLLDEAKLESIYDLDLLRRVEAIETLLHARPNNGSTQHVPETPHRTPGSKRAQAPTAGLGDAAPAA